MKQTWLVLGIWALAVLSFPALAQTSLRFAVTEFTVEGDNPLPPADARDVLKPFLGEEKSFADLQAAARALEELLHERGFTSYHVIVPEQDVRGAVVKLRVIGYKVGRIKVTGNAHFSDANVLAALPALKEGSAPDTNELSRELLLANEHPVKSLGLTFQESETPGAMDAVVAVTDERPYNVFALLNNYSSRDTPPTRVTVGAQHTNLFDRDHSLTATYTTSPEDFAGVKQYGFDYRLPIYPLASALSFYYVHSDVSSGVVAGALDVTGAGDFAGATYAYHLKRLDRYSHTLSLTAEDKSFENNSTIAGTPIAQDVRTRPFSLRYAATYALPRGSARAYAAYAHNLPGGADNDDEAYAAARSGAKRNWDAWRLGADFDLSIFQTWLLRARLDGQYSDEPLVPGEQFGLGGAGSVRGYDERLVSRESGVAVSLEVWSPAVKYVRAIGFVDAGYGESRESEASPPEYDNLSSVGVGLRASWRRNVFLEADVARTLSSAGGVSAGHTKVLFNLVLRY